MSYQFQTENSSAMRGCVFIDSSNPEFPNQVMNHSSHSFIKPPFPPLIDPKDLLIISKDNKPSRSPNAFIIYRKVFLKTTRDQGYFLPMTIVSSMASKSWDKESEEVRSYYKKLAKDAYKYRTEQFPKKIKRRRRREPWKTNNLAFQSDSHKTFSDDTTKLSSSSFSTLQNETQNTLENFSPNFSTNLEQKIEEPLSYDYSSNSSMVPSPIMNEIDEITINEINDNSELLNSDPIGSFNEQPNMEIYNQDFVNLWQQSLLNPINFSDTTFPNETNEIHEINKIHYPDYPDYPRYFSDHNNNVNNYNNNDNYYYTTNLAADFLNQDALGISYNNNPIGNASYL